METDDDFESEPGPDYDGHGTIAGTDAQPELYQ